MWNCMSLFARTARNKLLFGAKSSATLYRERGVVYSYKYIDHNF